MTARTVVFQLSMDVDDALDNNLTDLRERVSIYLYNAFYAYNPKIAALPEESKQEYRDWAILISAEMIQPGGRFAYEPQVQSYKGWYQIRSEDPAKQVLYLPPHIFNKCFRWATDEPLIPNEYNHVEEIV